jgi:hypothetical protein
MMENRRILSVIFGVAQGIIGVLSAAVAVLLFFNIIEVQTLFNASPEFLPLYLLILGLFSIFSIINTVFLLREWWRGK